MTLWELLAESEAARKLWYKDHTEEHRLEWRRKWAINLTCPGATWAGEETVGPGAYSRCTATVLAGEEAEPEEGVGLWLHYRGACVGCGWVDARARASENEAAEDAEDHAHPGWRWLPAVPEPPQPGMGPGHEKQVQAWLAKARPLLPAGWLEAGGPIRTVRGEWGTRHVPLRTPYGGYDMACTKEEAGPLTLF